MSRRVASIVPYVLVLAALAAGSAARAQDVPNVISPIQVQSDRNGVNLIDGRIAMDLPTLSVPGAPNLRFDRVQNAAPYIRGNILVPPGNDTDHRFYAVHTGAGTSDSFECWLDSQCQNLSGSGSRFNWRTRTYRQAGSGAIWQFGELQTSTPTQVHYYASSVTYPNGEVISYSYQNPGSHRPVAITSSLGYYIALSYQGDDLYGDPTAWASVAEATLYASGLAAPLGRLSYSGATITDHGNRPLGDSGGRTYTCTGCGTAMGNETEVNAGSSQLPGEGSPALIVASAPSQGGTYPIQTVTRDGVQWTYSYDGLAYQSKTYGYTYAHLTVAGPNGYHNVYSFGTTGKPDERRNLLSGATDSIGRATQYLFDEVRPISVVFPEGNRIDLAYDSFGNAISRTTTPKPGSGLPAIFETASYPTTCAPDDIPTALCWRPTWSRDGLQRQTDYAYNDLGQLTGQTDPADANGVRRRTYIEYEAGTLSRRHAVRICGDITTCGTSAEIRTEYDYWGSTFLPSAERRIDAAAGVTLETRYGYDAAGRLLSVDGPLAGADDSIYYRYDEYGRRTWEIGARAPGGLHIATHFTYRDADDKPVSTETGTLADPTAESLTLSSPRRTDIAYDSRRNPVRATVSAQGTTFSVVDRSFDDQGRLECETRRMNPDAFASPPIPACELGPRGANDFGPDRITRNVYDAAGQRLQLRKGLHTDAEGTEATWAYNLNGQVTTMIDGNGNRAELRYDGHGRQDRWTFPSPARPAAFNDATPASALATAGSANAGDYEEYGYDLAGNRTSLRKRDGSVLTYQYDALNRMIVKIVPERAGLTAAQTRDVHYGYDLRNLQLYARFDSATGEGVTNGYDGFGRLASSSVNLGGVTRTLGYQYDAAGNRTRITHPDGQHFDYRYDALNRFIGLKENGDSDIVSQYYYPTGERYIIGRTGAATGYLRDGLGRATTLVDDLPAGTGTSWTFGYNPASQIVTAARTNDAYAWTGHYAVNRAYTTNGLNQYAATASSTGSGPGSASFGYDANGNLASDGSRGYSYDIENRLIGTSTGLILSYDPLGRLFQTSGGASGTTRFLYDGDALIAEYNDAGTVLRRYVHGSGVDEPLLLYDGASVSWENRRQLFADQQGSIVAVTDYLGNGLAINAYDEYGIPAATNSGRFQYTGQIWLPDLGMYHYKARVYSPTLGRFLQTDPVGYQGGISLYGYVGDDPVNGSDPTGQYECRTQTDCDTAQTGINQIRAARNFYRSPVIGSRLARAEPAARALDRVLGSLGRRGDGGVNIREGNAGGNRGQFDANTNTITLNTAQIGRTGSGIGEALGHETQHYRQRNENLSPLAEEARPLLMEYIIGRAPGGSISGISGRDYVNQRLNRDYCRLSARYCNPAVDRVMNEELQKPF